jgi:hypothetical protein
MKDKHSDGTVPIESSTSPGKTDTEELEFVNRMLRCGIEIETKRALWGTWHTVNASPNNSRPTKPRITLHYDPNNPDAGKSTIDKVDFAALPPGFPYSANKFNFSAIALALWTSIGRFTPERKTLKRRARKRKGAETREDYQ